MIKCKKNGIYMTGCTEWMGGNPIEGCEICVLRGHLRNPWYRGGVRKTIRKNKGGPAKIRETCLNVSLFGRFGDTLGEDQVMEKEIKRFLPAKGFWSIEDLANYLIFHQPRCNKNCLIWESELSPSPQDTAIS